MTRAIRDVLLGYESIKMTLYNVVLSCFMCSTIAKALPATSPQALSLQADALPGNALPAYALPVDLAALPRPPGAYALPANVPITSLPADQPFIDPDTITVEPDLNYKTKFDDRPGLRLDERDLFVAVLHCMAGMTRKSSSRRILTPGICHREGFGKVGIRFESTAPDSKIPSGYITFGIYYGISEMVRLGKFKKLTVKLYENPATFVGTVFFEQYTDTAHLLSASANQGINIFNGFEDITASNDSQPTTSDPGRNDVAKDTITFDVTAPNLCSLPAKSSTDPNTALSASPQRVTYTYDIKSTPQHGLTLMAWTMACIRYMKTISENAQKAHKIAITPVKAAPVQRRKLSELEITMFAGYRDIPPQSGECPKFSAEVLIIAMVEVPVRLLGSPYGMDFFMGRILEGGVPLGYLWAEKGLPTEGTGWEGVGAAADRAVPEGSGTTFR